MYNPARGLIIHSAYFKNDTHILISEGGNIKNDLQAVSLKQSELGTGPLLPMM